MSNYGNGFPAFVYAIEEVSHSLGGDHTREVVAIIFSDCLMRVIQKREGLRYPSYSRVNWTKATELDFDTARCDALNYLEREWPPIEAFADWKGARLEVRGDVVVLSSAYYSIPVAMVTSREDYDRRARDKIMKWMAFLTDNAKHLISTSFSSSPTSVTAKSEASGQKSLRKIVETFFGVKFADCA